MSRGDIILQINRQPVADDIATGTERHGRIVRDRGCRVVGPQPGACRVLEAEVVVGDVRVEPGPGAEGFAVGDGQVPGVMDTGVITDPAGRTYSFEYSGDHISKVTDVLGRTNEYSYDGTGNLQSYKNPEGGLILEVDGRVETVTSGDVGFI